MRPTMHTFVAYITAGNYDIVTTGNNDIPQLTIDEFLPSYK